MKLHLYISLVTYVNFAFIVLRVLKENYATLCRCLPQDYNKTINTMQRLFKLPDGSAYNLTALPTANLINEKIVVSLIAPIKSDKGALNFCVAMKRLSSTIDIEMLRKGMKLI